MSKFEVTADSLNVRSGPGEAYEIWDSLQKGDVVEELDITGWCPIEMEDGSTGWVFRQYLEVAPETPAPVPAPEPRPSPVPTPSPIDGKPMKTSQAGLEFIKQQEGCVLHVYNDQTGHPTIGIGHLIQPGESFEGDITEQQALELLATDVARFEEAVNSYRLPLTQNQFDVLVDFSFNCGVGNLKILIDQGLDQVPQRLPAFCHSGGEVLDALVKRRAAEGQRWSASDEPPWITWLKSKLGFQEGINDAEIDTWFQYTTLPKSAWDDRVTAWCAVTVNAALFINGKTGNRSALAVDFLNWGIKTDDSPQVGDVAIWDWSNIGKSGNHVNFFLADLGDYVRCIGGNQGSQGAVSIDRCPKKAIMGYRRPV